MIEIDKVYLLGLAEAGDAELLRKLGIELLILCHQGMTWPHVKDMGVVALNIEEDGSAPKWIVEDMAALARQSYGKRVMALADKHGGLCQAVFFLACIRTEAIEVIEDVLPERDGQPKTDIPPEVRAVLAEVG